MTEEQLKKVREWLIWHVFRSPEVMCGEERFIEVYGDPGERTEIDTAEIIASLYELLHITVTGEKYNYMFHWANKAGSWVEDNLFTDLIKEED